MSPLLVDIVVKASALLAAAGLVDAALQRRGSAAARHLVWSIAVAGLLVLPIASSALPHWQVRIPVPRASVANLERTPAATVAPAESASAAAAPLVASGPAEPRAAAGDRARFPPPALKSVLDGLSVFYVFYVGGVLILLARFGRERFVLGRVTRTSRPVRDPKWVRLLAEAARQSNVGRAVRLLQSRGELMPMTFGTRVPTVVLPASADDWTDDRRRVVLLHELAHIARHDCLVQRLSAFTCAVYWPHPGVWWAARRLRTERELACDDRVLAAGAGPREYAGHLLDLAHALGAVAAPATALGMARARQLESRLLAVLDVARNRAALPRGRLIVALATSIAFLLPMAALRAAVVPYDRPDARPAAPGGPALAASQAADRQSTAVAVQDLAGTWEIRLSRDTGSVHLSLRTLHGSNGTTLPLTRFEGLAGSQISGAGAAVHFTSRRDAGTLAFDGVCRGGLCGGTYAFEPNPAFAAELTKRGIGTPTPREQYELALADVGVGFLDELSVESYRKPAVQGLVRAAEHGVGLEYVRGMASLGYRLGTLDTLIRLRDHGVDPEYVRGMAANGFARLSEDDLVHARDHGVDPPYVKGMRDLGYPFGDLARLTAARDHGVDPAFASGLAALGYTNLPFDALMAARDHGVDPDYVGAMRSFGFRLTLDGLTRTRDHGVDPEYVRGLAALGYNGLDVDALVRARDHGVDPQYVRDLSALGYKALPLDMLIRMRDHGVDPEYVRRVQQRGLGRLSVDELIRRRDQGDGDPDAAARAVAAGLQSLWKSRAARFVNWLRD
jgi:beta-lactamase regulating signal transducer with metallopeptidase domain